jgi:hypothetical protein
MSPIQILLVSWVGLTIVSLLIGWVAYFCQKGTFKLLKLSDFINLAIASATIVSSCSLMYRAITSQEILNLLQFDIITFVNMKAQGDTVFT